MFPFHLKSAIFLVELKNRKKKIIRIFFMLYKHITIIHIWNNIVYVIYENVTYTKLSYVIMFIIKLEKVRIWKRQVSFGILLKFANCFFTLYFFFCVCLQQHLQQSYLMFMFIMILCFLRIFFLLGARKTKKKIK